MTLKAQNGWDVLEPGDPRLFTWTIPTKDGPVRLTLRNGSAGFLLCHFLLWWADVIEPLVGKVLDDWGWAVRPIRGQATGYSNHAAGCASDANATKHPLGTYTLTKVELAKIWVRLKLYQGVLRHGAFYSGRVDQMHVEVIGTLAAAEKVAHRLMNTKRGRAILAANPTQAAVIMS